MGYLYVFMVIEPFKMAASKSLTIKQGVVVSSGVVPAVLTLMWKDQNVYAVTISPLLGLACALIGLFNCHILISEDQSTNQVLKLGS